MKYFNFDLKSVLFLLLCGLGAGVLGCQGGGDGQNLDHEPPAPNAPYVTVRDQTLPSIETLPGRVLSIRTAEVRPQVTGILQERLFTEGDFVEKGEPLYQIDPDVFRANVSASRASLASAQAELKLADQEHARTKELADSGIATDRELDTATANLDLAKARVKSAKAQLERSALDLGYAKVEAPLSGRISISKITEGALVSPQDPNPMTVIQQVDQVYVDLKEPLDSYQKLQQMIADGTLVTDEEIDVTILSIRGEALPLKATYQFTDTAVDSTTSEVTIRVLVDNEDMMLRPGMLVRASLNRGKMTNVPTVPQQAVKHDATLGSFVFIIDDENKAQMKVVKTGSIINGNYVLLDGVKHGARVITEGHANIREGETVTPVEWKAADAGDLTNPSTKNRGSQKGSEKTQDSDAREDVNEDEAER